MSNIVLTEHLASLPDASIPLWINGWDYGEKLLNKGKTAPWGDVGAFVSFHKQLQGLLGSDVLTVNVGAFYDFWLQQNPGLLQQMASKRRLGFALRTLLANQSARQQLHEIVAAVCESNSGMPVLLEMSSPKSWMGDAHCKAQKKDSTEVSWDDAESASMYVADFIRLFSDCALSGIVLHDSEGDGPASEADTLRYQPVINVAEHYNWQVALNGCSNDFTASSDQGVSVCLGSQEGAQGQTLTPSYFSDRQGAPAISAGQFMYVVVPSDAIPESVLECLAELRKGME
jgi:hypothetical protein